tara:strand:+ start:1412 stop:2389 length:978 start_codon:yes stop_codon:yes gene_type:complete
MAKNKAQVNEGVLDDMDDDGWMAKSQLYQTAKYAIELHKMIQDTDNLEPWVQSKITKCADYLESIKHYMEYEAVNNHPEEVPAEAPVEIEQESVNEAPFPGEYDYTNYPQEDEEIKAIMMKHPQDVAKMKQMGDIDTNSELYMELYSYYSNSGEMPYGTQKARDGDPVEWIMDRLDDLGLIESQIDEGYESSVLRVMKDHGISAYFSNGVMYVDAMDMDKAKEALELDSDITELPKMVAEKAKESIGSDTEDLWLEKMASAGLKRANEGSMSDIAAAADEVATMIEAGATDQEIMDHTGLRDAQVKFLRNSLQDRPAQYEAKKAK